MKFKSNDPYQIAKDNGIMVIVEPLANIHGYYNNVLGKKFIHVNDMLPEYFRRFVVAHMLYGATYKPNEMMFLREKSTFTKTEVAANKFASELLAAFEVEQLESS